MAILYQKVCFHYSLYSKLSSRCSYQQKPRVPVNSTCFWCELNNIKDKAPYFNRYKYYWTIFVNRSFLPAEASLLSISFSYSNSFCIFFRRNLLYCESAIWRIFRNRLSLFLNNWFGPPMTEFVTKIIGEIVSQAHLPFEILLMELETSCVTFAFSSLC